MVIWHRRQIEEILPSKRKACKKGRCSALATGASIHALQRPRAFSVMNLDANRGILVFCRANAASKDTYPIQKCRSATGKLGFQQRGPRPTRNLPFNLSTVHTHSGTTWGPLREHQPLQTGPARTAGPQAAGVISRSIGGGGVISGNFPYVRVPLATSANTLFTVSSVRVELT